MNKEPWRCPGCGTWYSPAVERCECQKPEGMIIRYVPVPQPYYVPTWIRPYDPWHWQPYRYTTVCIGTTNDSGIKMQTINASAASGGVTSVLSG